MILPSLCRFQPDGNLPECTLRDDLLLLSGASITPVTCALLLQVQDGSGTRCAPEALP